jgi:hypothetical protein
MKNHQNQGIFSRKVFWDDSTNSFYTKAEGLIWGKRVVKP